MTLLLQLVLYCLIYILLVKYAVRDSGLNCLYFYPKEYLEEAHRRGIDHRSLESHCGFQNGIHAGRSLSRSRELVRCACYRQAVGRTQQALNHQRYGGRTLCQTVEEYSHKTESGHGAVPDNRACRSRHCGADSQYLLLTNICRAWQNYFPGALSKYQKGR